MDIVEELRQNRESGAKRLESEYKAGLMTLAMRFCDSPSDAEELVNRTFAAVVAGIDDYLEQSAFFGWMCQILKNIHSLDQRRKSNSNEIYPGELPDVMDEDAQEEIYRSLDRSLVRDALEKLEDSDREVLIMRYFLDMPIGKMAKILAVPSGTVKSRLHYARKALAIKLGAKVEKAKKAAKKPVVKAMLLALALCALTAAGAAVWWGELSERAATVASGGATSTLPAIGETGETGETSGFSSVASTPTPVPPDSPVPPVITQSLSSKEQPMNATTLRTLAASAAFAAASAAIPYSTAQAAVKSSVFDDVKIWYKGSAGNAVGTADSAYDQLGRVKNLPNLADTSSAMHGGEYYWWGWRMSYENQTVVCPYAGVTLDSTPCMVVNSPVTTNGLETVTINGEEMQQPNISYRTGNLHFTNWLADRETACSNYTVFLRFRNESINPVPSNHNRALALGIRWTDEAGAAAGVDLRMAPADTLSDYAYPRIVVGNNQMDCSDVLIRNGCWVDCVIAVDGQTLTATFCWDNGTDCAISRVSRTYPISGPQPSLSPNCTVQISGEASRMTVTFTNGVACNGNSWTYGFRGAFHQIAFWERTLNDNEIREAMAAGAGRPDLVHVGIEGNGIEEFKTSGQTASVSNTGAWEYLNPTLSSANSTATISFSCPALWANQSQWLRLPVASGGGKVSAAVNGTSVGECAVAANGVGRIFVPENVIVFGENTLVVTCTEGTFSLDAVTLGGSWRFGESLNSFANAPATIDQFMFNPAGANDKFRDRTLRYNSGDYLTQFRFFVPNDLVGHFRGLFTTRVQNTGGETYNFEFLANGASLGTYGLKGGKNYEIKVPEDNVVSGWNTFAWKRLDGWANIDWHRFNLWDESKPFVIIMR